ncbi:hypothetical protein [Pollutimonas sp. M17]|uniref:hypothetical protein n=1 Tax=Pollutimonas sp. M17 TaxID=2962065 RepID=UPI0021F3D02C|nr:hypothetical protein [Pollutimonas sp. M17]UYO95227.1 hypothetical protein OEG81_08015 [Pollutimonas sp. M17]
MRIVLPGALPDPREARELISYLPAAAPTLMGWLERGHATSTTADAARAGCTPFEQWQLMHHGFQPRAGQNCAAGLGPLLAADTAEAGRPVWLAELVHVSPSRDGAALLPARELAIAPDQSVALFESVQALFSEVDFTLHPGGTDRWRIELPGGYAPSCASPALVAITSVNDWWSQDMAGRPWRRLVNEVQMLWYEHPVNQERYRQGLVPINSLWLFGGASPDQLTKPPAPDPETRVHGDLLASSIAHDWGGWLAALGELEARVFQPLARNKPPEIVLIGNDRYVELKTAALGRWTQWLPGSRNAWRKWWSHQD